MSKQSAYHTEHHDDLCEEYSMLVGPDDFECILTEPEDRCWYRDLNVVIVRLNEQYDRIEQLVKLVTALSEMENE